MDQYRHGGEIYDKKVYLDFSVNTNPLGLPEGVRKALISQTDSFARYPDNRCGGLTKAIAEYEKVSRDFIICGNGASDLIYRLCYALKPKRAMITAPAFSEYEKALREAGSEVVYCCLEEQEEFRVTGRLGGQLNKQLDVLFLCNPNNPVGNLISPGLLEDVMEQCLRHHIFLVMDECFMDFTEKEKTHSLKKYVADNDGIFLLKAFTKQYAMAGLRLGYGICSDKRLLELMHGTGPSWNVSVPAQLAGIEALKEETYRIRTRELIGREREYLCQSLENLGLKVFKPTANYIFFKGRDSLYDALLARGILVRHCDNYNRLNKEFYRIAVKKHEENVILIQEIEECLKE